MNFKAFICFIFACLAIFCCVFFSKQIIVVKQSNHLVIGTSADYPPYAFIDTKTNTVIGFDIDVARAVAERMNKTCTIQDSPFLSLILGLLAGDIDFVAAAVTPTEQRAKKVSFSINYLDADPLIAVHKKNTIISSLDDLSTLSIAVNTGYTADLFLSSIPNIQLTKLDSPAEAIMALTSGSVDAFVCAASSLKNMLASKKLDEFSMFTLSEAGDSYALVVNKDNVKLLKEINSVLLSMKQDGTLQSLQTKWGLA